ncbi:MAG: TonB-dependent receptor [Gemmatimonadales bacterium]
MTRHQVPRLLRLGVLCLAVSAPAAAQQRDSTRQDSVAVLAPIQVTAERERAAPPPVAATSIDGLTFQRTHTANPYLALRQVSGIEVHDQGQGPGFASNVVMRGFTSDHSSDILLVIDGVPVNLPSHGHIEGYADWNVLLPRTISSMRVIHGGASPLYGDFALGGAVEVFTRADKQGVDATAGASSFGDVRFEGDAGIRRDGGGLYVGGGYRREQGWRPNSNYWLASGVAHGWLAAGGGRLEGGLSLYDTNWRSPGFVDVATFNIPSFDRFADSTDGGHSRRAVLHGRSAVPLTQAAYLQAVGWGMASNYDLFLNIPGHSHGAGTSAVVQSGEHDDRTGTGGQVELGWLAPFGELLLGVSARADWIDYTHATTFERAVIAPEVDLDARHAAGSVYGRWRRRVGNRLGLDLGMRWDVLRHESRSNLAATPVWESATNGILSPKLGARYQLSSAWSFRGSVARGFRSPVGIIGDPTRQPYVAWSYELGIDHHLRGAAVEVSLFRVDVDHERVQDPISMAISGTGSSRRQGIDAAATFSLPRSATLQLRGTYNHARLSALYVNAHDDHPLTVFGSTTSTTPDARYGDWVPGVSEYKGFLRLALPFSDRFDVSSSLRVEGPHVPIGEAAVRTQPYHVLDVGTSFRIRPGLELDVDLENLTNTRYVELRASGYVTPGTPRAIRTQLRWSSLGY